MSINIWVDQGVVIAPLSSDQPGQPSVIYETGAQILSGTVFKMWFGTANGTCYAESTDGISWTRYGSNPVIASGAHDYPEVYKFGSTYYCYTGISGGPVKAYTSSNGIAWTLQNATALSRDQAWEGGFMGQLIPAGQIGGTWYGYYSALSTVDNQYHIGQATSTDLINWTKNGANPVITTANASGLRVYNINGVYYGWAQIVQPGIPAFGTLSIPSDVGRFSASTPAGPWTLLPVPTSYRTLNVEGVGSTIGQWADPYLVEALGNVYMFTSISSQGNTANTQIGCAIASATTLAQIVQTYEGIVNTPFTSNAGLALNLTTLASDNFTRADANPIGGNWTQLSNGAGFGANQIVSNKVRPTNTSQADYSYYNAISFPNDQWSATTISVATSASVGCGTRLATNNTQNGYIFFWAGPAGGVGTAGQFFIGKWVAGTFTQLFASGAGTFTVNAGDVITGTSIGTRHCLYHNGNLVGQPVIDASLASGAAGLLENSTVIANAQISAWSGGSVTNPPAPPAVGASSDIGGTSGIFNSGVNSLRSGGRRH